MGTDFNVARQKIPFSKRYSSEKDIALTDSFTIL